MGSTQLTFNLFLSGVKDNGKDFDIQCTFNLIEPTGYIIGMIPTNVLQQNVTKDRIEYIDFSDEDEHGWPIDLNGNKLSFTLQLIQ